MGFPVYMVPSGDVIPVFFSTYAGATGASITMTGLAITDVEIYKDTSMTQRASDAGIVLIDTDGIDVDGVTGIHGFSIDTGDNTDASFYTVGAWFHVVVSAVTVDSQTVNFIACAFRIMAAESSAGVQKVDVSHFGGSAGTFASGRPETNATHVGGTSQTGRDLGASVLLSSGTGTGQLDFTSGVVKSNMVQILATALTETAGLLAGGFKKFFNVASPTLTCLGIDQTGDNYARLGAPAGASVSADIAAVKSDSAAILVDTGTTLDARIPAALVSGRMDSSVGAVASGVIAAASFAAGAFDAVWTVTNRTITAFSTALAVSVWDVLASAVATASSIGLQIKTNLDVVLSTRLGTPAGASVSADIAAVKAETAAILADTAEIGTAGAGLTNINLPNQTMDIVGNITGNLSGSVGSVTGAVGSVTGAVGSVTGAVGSVTGNVGGNVTGSVGSLAAQAKLDVNAEVDTALADYDAPTSAELVSEINSVQSDIAALPTAAENADAVWEEAIADHSGTSGSTAEALGAAGAAGDPWATAVPGAYAAGTAGSRLGRVPDVAAGASGGLFIAGTNAATSITTALTANVTGNVTGNLSGSVGSVTGAVGSVTAGVTLAASAVQAIWDALTSALTTVNSIGKLLVDNINATISSRLASASYTAPPTVGQIADQVWEEPIADHSGTVGSTAEALGAAGSAGDPWSTAVPGAYGAGTAGSRLGRVPDVAAGAAGGLFIAGSNAATTVNVTGNLTGNVSGSVGSVTGAVGSVTGSVGGNVVGSVASVTGAVGSVTAGVTLAASAVQAIWDALTSALTTVGSVGKLLVDNINATISSRATPAQVNTEVDTALADYDAPTSAELVTEINSVQTDLAAVSALVGQRATPAQVNSEMLDVLNVDTFAQPGQEAPPATTTPIKQIGYIYKAFRNKFTQSATEASLFADDGTTVDQKATVSDNGTVFTRNEFTSGP